jgi:mannitol-specific phosphotransferase system IIBC component
VTLSKQKGAKNEQNEQNEQNEKNKSITKKCYDKFVCEICNKQYVSRNGLWKHRKTCKMEGVSNIEQVNTVIYNQPTDKDLIMMLIKENSELKSKFVTVNSFIFYKIIC